MHLRVKHMYIHVHVKPLYYRAPHTHTHKMCLEPQADEKETLFTGKTCLHWAPGLGCLAILYCNTGWLLVRLGVVILSTTPLAMVATCAAPGLLEC